MFRGSITGRPGAQQISAFHRVKRKASLRMCVSVGVARKLLDIIDAFLSSFLAGFLSIIMVERDPEKQFRSFSVSFLRRKSDPPNQIRPLTGTVSDETVDAVKTFSVSPR
jgi:hypothetical protein